MVNLAMCESRGEQVFLWLTPANFPNAACRADCALREIDTVISDARLGEEIQEKLRLLGCNLLLA